MSASPAIVDWRQTAIHQLLALPSTIKYELDGWTVKETRNYLKDIFQSHSSNISATLVEIVHHETQG